MEIVKGYVAGINGNMAKVSFEGPVRKNEVGYILVDGAKLKGEVIRVNNGIASMQIYEMSNGIKVGDPVEFTGELMSVDLGPGLLTQIYDGLQNPLPELAEQCGFFLERGVYLDAIPDRDWEFTPLVKAGDSVEAGVTVGTVPEGLFTHHIMVPFTLKGSDWTVKSIAEKGTYNVHSTVCVIENGVGDTKELSMIFSQPIKQPVKCYEERLRPDEPLVMKLRCIDTFLPIAKGGTFCVPGPFGAGKTVLQHMEAKNGEVDIVIVAACGERAGEVVEILKEFPELEDPRTGRSLMERTIIICNTSSMPVAAREASCYTAVTLAEYYRQMGLNVLLLADSTSRWAQAMREMSGRLEEIPGEEAFPAYLESTIAAFYERAGKVRLRDGSIGSVTIGGTVSPAGGNFEEPVTQATLKVVGAFHGLSRERSDARKYPAINPVESWSKYDGIVDMDRVENARDILKKSVEVSQMMKVVGEEGTSADDYIDYQKGELLDAVYLQQNSFDEIDAADPPERQRVEFDVLYDILTQKYDLEDKTEIRSFFNELRQKFLDWHGTVFETPEFEAQEKSVSDFYTARTID
ncbi:V/A-type H+-transporting ATPase subunit A [Eubacterium pyruvativorans]|uniref:V-type ATP synthase alpha chain n=1 Tax=Eubacterium pyruvativorans TaxID=155865 RepID=A0A1I7H8I9_9FIRM|nr:V-type ATP synthase subunit A [Eubacterium pyruvativorans]MCI5746721.1 V-type ATP synthase subunit A [Eubacterium pyruvativorans]MDD6708496.1 V-type ATP synthase subunit A [Eubacterium pyruvativorans]MDD7684289.1 V-type ATP synthase subunit A [Eubacterium pyruvativorans]MDY4049741.1 V-type ATP synthase subunit A [Eubacterium pyruvativorans]SFO22676.1 V/A-type H+-transporting ATPase subunit A [Eubacterium pyruvativorans]